MKTYSTSIHITEKQREWITHNTFNQAAYVRSLIDADIAKRKGITRFLK
jgi:hypothetical protein